MEVYVTAYCPAPCEGGVSVSFPSCVGSACPAGGELTQSASNPDIWGRMFNVAMNSASGTVHMRSTKPVTTTV